MASGELDHLLGPIFGRSHAVLTRERALRLTRIQALLEALGHPERRFLAVQVIGTSGKGSTAAILSSVLTSAGIRVGLSTKPFLVSPTEHFRINDRDVLLAKVRAVLRSMRPAVRIVERRLRDRPTAFEILTAAGAVLFANEEVRVGIFEAGLGGRTDATTALRAPIKIITSISRDHVVSLGPALSDIAKHKSAAIRRGDVVITTSRGSARRIIQHTCRQRGAAFVDALKPLGRRVRTTLRGTTFAWKSRRYQTTLIGPHQAENAAAALAALEILQARGFAANQPMIHRGLQDVRWPGRFEIVKPKPRIILDGAHNPSKISALVQTLDALRIPRSRIICLFCCKQTKDAPAMLRRLAPACRLMIYPRLASVSNLVPPKDLQAIASGHTAVSLHDGLNRAGKLARRSDTILLTGSLTLVGQYKRTHP